MLKGKYVISMYLRCMKEKSSSSKFPECKQITRPEFLLVYIFRFLYLPVGVRERLRDESRGRQDIVMSFAALYVNNFCRFPNHVGALVSVICLGPFLSFLLRSAS